MKHLKLCDTLCSITVAGQQLQITRMDLFILCVLHAETAMRPVK